MLVLFITILFYLTLPIESKRVVYIPKGSTSNAISYLNENGYSLNLIDRVALFFIGYPQSGWMDMNMKAESTMLTKLDFLYKITTSKAALAKVVLIPGETYYFFINELSVKLKLPKDELFKAYNELAYKKDGNILSQTYTLPIGMDPKDLLAYLFEYTENEYKKYSLKVFGKYDRAAWYRYVAIASVIQKESGSKEEMTEVSGVVYNRLAKKMKLQMDGTLNYGPYSHVKVTPTMIANDNTPYNTYKFAGIPSDPVCAVEFDAIKAAVFPAKSSFLFFMKKADGSGHSFAKDFSDHKANISNVIEAKKKLVTTNTNKPELKSIKDEVKAPVKKMITQKKDTKKETKQNITRETKREIKKDIKKDSKKETKNAVKQENSKKNIKNKQPDAKPEKKKETKKEISKTKTNSDQKVKNDSKKLHKETKPKQTKEIWKSVQ